MGHEGLGQVGSGGGAWSCTGRSPDDGPESAECGGRDTTELDDSDTPGHEEYPTGDAIEYDEDGVSVLETDQTPGGWAAADVIGRQPRPPRPPDRDPERAVRRVVGTMLWEWRSRRGMTQRVAARHLGVQQARLSALERGRAPVGIDLLARLAGLTGSAVVLTIGVADSGTPVRRLVGDGSRGRAAVRVVVDGPEGRRVP